MSSASASPVCCSLLLLLLLLAAGDVNGEIVKLTKEWKQKFLDAHNSLRATTANGATGSQPKAANIQLMAWDDRLMKKAETWALHCELGHDSNENRLIPGYRFVGQNGGDVGEDNFTATIQYWYDEHVDFMFDSNACKTGKVCGHYTQVIWHNSGLVGCAVSKCSSNQLAFGYLYCNYAPGGNMVGSKPYSTGEPATDCPGPSRYSMGGLCATKEQCNDQCHCALSAQHCENGATLDSQNCRCKCPDGFYGNRCQYECKNKEGYEETCSAIDPSQMCGMYKDTCLKTCNRCSDPSQIDSSVENSDGVIPRVPGAAAPPSTSAAPPSTSAAPPSTFAAPTSASAAPSSSATPSIETEPPTSVETIPPTTTVTVDAGTTAASGCADATDCSHIADYKEAECQSVETKLMCAGTCGGDACALRNECKDHMDSCSFLSSFCNDASWPDVRVLCRKTCTSCT